jgi:hypothetical protein
MMNQSASFEMHAMGGCGRTALQRAGRRLVLAALCIGMVAGTALMTGCSSTPTAVDYARPYPTGVARGRTLDIQVFRETQYIEFTNTTATAYGPSTLWLNGSYCLPIEGLAIGQTLKFRLNEFRDEFSEPFREGGFFAIEKPDRLVLAQLETAGEAGQVMLGLVVVGTGNEE